MTEIAEMKSEIVRLIENSFDEITLARIQKILVEQDTRNYGDLWYGLSDSEKSELISAYEKSKLNENRISNEAVQKKYFTQLKMIK